MNEFGAKLQPILNQITGKIFNYSTRYTCYTAIIIALV